jgi:MFS family permease
MTDVLGILALVILPLNKVAVYFCYRFLAGAVSGLNSVMVIIYIIETAPITLQGLCGSMNQVFINIGIITAYYLGYGV